MASPDDTSLEVALNAERQVELTLSRQDGESALIVLRPLVAFELARRIITLLDGNNMLRIKMN